MERLTVQLVRDIAIQKSLVVIPWITLQRVSECLQCPSLSGKLYSSSSIGERAEQWSYTVQVINFSSCNQESVLPNIMYYGLLMLYIIRNA